MPGMVPEDVYELTGVADPRLSPDGRTVAFVVWRMDREANEYKGNVWLAPVDGSGPPRQLTFGSRRDADPRWSPDGTMLAFTSNRVGDAMQLHVIPVSGGGEARKLTDLKEDVKHVAWSPDGSRISFDSRVRADYYDEEDEKKRPPRRITRLFYKLDNEGWTADRPSHLFVVPADGSGEPTQLTSGEWQDSNPSWSPDGSRIAFLYTPGLFDDPRHGQVAVIPAAGGMQKLLSTDLDRNCSSYPELREPVWDGDDLLFVAEDSGNSHVYRVPADGSGRPKMVVGGDQVLAGFDAVLGTIVTSATTPTSLAELFAGDRQLTEVGKPFAAGRELRAPEQFTAISTDGTEVEAWIMRPAGFQKGKKYPLLLNIHGGPFTQYGNKFFDEFQVYAGAGYAVVYSNPRGSSGYSE